MPSCRPLVLGIAVALLIPTALAPDAVASPASVPVCSHGPDRFDNADLDGDGYADLVVGVPDATAAGLAGAGIEDIQYPHPTAGLAVQRLGEAYFGEATAAGDRFGASSAYTAPAPNSGCSGLVIGAPGAVGGRGTATFALGSDHGISSVGATHVTGPRAGDGFGAVVVSDTTNIWVAAPNDSVDGHAGAGAIYQYGYDAATGRARFLRRLTEDSAAALGGAGTGDHFGQALAVNYGALAVGIPGRTVRGAAGAGAVALLGFDDTADAPLVGASQATQDSPGVAGVPEAGDGMGSSVSVLYGRIAVGIPGEDIGTLRDAGMVQTFDGLAHPEEALTQGSPTVPGTPEAGDRFGASVQYEAASFLDQGSELWIGSPGESIGSVAGSGNVVHLQLREYPPNEGTYFNYGPVLQLGGGDNGDYLPGSPQTDAHVGAALGLLSSSYTGDDFTNGEGIVASVPGLDNDGVDTGEVWVDVGAATVGAGVHRDSAGPQPGEQYGIPATNVTNGPLDG